MTNVSANQNSPFSSQRDYERALTNVGRIEEAIRFANEGKPIVGGLDPYIRGYSDLTRSIIDRERLGVEEKLRGPHNELHAALTKLAERVVAAAAKVSLDAATKAANTPKSPSILRFLTLRQWVKYGSISTATLVFVFFAREFVWRWIKGIPPEIPTIAAEATETAKEVALTLASTAETGAIVLGSALAGVGDVIGGIRDVVRDHAPEEIGKAVRPSPTTFSSAIRTAAMGVAAQVACSVGLKVSLGWLVKSATGYALPTHKICAPFVAGGMIFPKPAVLGQWAVNQTREYPKTITAVEVIGGGIVAGGIAVRGAELFVPAFHNAVEPQLNQGGAQVRAGQEMRAQALAAEGAPAPQVVPPWPPGERAGAGAGQRAIEELHRAGVALRGAGDALQDVEDAQGRAIEQVQRGMAQQLADGGEQPQPPAQVGVPPPQVPQVAAPAARVIAPAVGVAGVGQAQAIKRALQIAAATAVVAATAGGIAVVTGAGVILSGVVAVTAGGAALTIGATKVVLFASRILLGPRGWQHLNK